MKPPSAAVTASTLPQLLAAAADRGQGGWFFHSGRNVVALPVRDLYSRALRRASELQKAGVGRGTNLGLVGLNTAHWAEWAWATWLAGATLVPLAAPVVVSEFFPLQVASLAEATGCSVVVGEKRYLKHLKGESVARWDWSAPVPHSGLELNGAGAGGARTAETGSAISPDDVAVILCTSGSTAAPKGTRMSHARAIEWARHNALPDGGDKVPAMVTWFPFYHVAGLGLLFEVVTPVDQHVVSMKSFLADPASWLRLVSETGASYAVSPSSVWSEVLGSLLRRPEGVELSHLDEIAFNAELAEADVVQRMRDVLGPLGLRPGRIGVHYASSEAGMISQTQLGADPRVDTVDLGELVRSGRALPAREGQPSKRVVSCGRPYPGVDVCVGPPGRPLPERQVGDVWVRGPGVTDGYVNAGNENFEQGWLRTGDLAYTAEGELFVTGRADEVVVCFGEKYHPEDIERAVLRATGLGPQTCAAFSPQEGRPGDLVVVVEAQGPAHDLAGVARAAVADAVGLTPSEVLVVAPGTVPKTPNGKLQRARLRQMHARQELTAGEGYFAAR